MHKSDSRRLTCAACQHQNEIERVYCHNCGEKLDRSLLPPLEEKSEDDRAKESRKVKAMMNPNRLNWLRTFKTILLLEFLAAVVAAGYLAAQEPAHAAPISRDRFPDLEAGDVWSEMVKARPATAVQFKEFDLNYYLRKSIKGAEGPMGIKFERAFVHLEPGLVTLGTQRDAWGLAIYNSATLRPLLIGGKWSAEITGYAIGRLTIPVALARVVNLESITLGALSKVFDKEVANLARVEKLEVGKGVLSITTKPL